MTTTHTPIINADHAKCSCRHWHGAYRNEKEHQGQFTSRAMDEHRKHEAEAEIFEARQTGLFDTQVPLFGDVQC